MGVMNSIRSIAIVATGPPERCRAIMPAALSIWLKTQPPKIWPLALMSPGPGIRRRIGSRRTSVMGGPPLEFGRLDIGPAHSQPLYPQRVESGHLEWLRR